MPEPIVTFNEESLKTDLRELVRSTVEEMLNGLLDEEADDLVGAVRYERTAARGVPRRPLRAKAHDDVRRGHDPMPKLKGMRFTTAIIGATGAARRASRRQKR